MASVTRGLASCAGSECSTSCPRRRVLAAWIPLDLHACLDQVSEVPLQQGRVERRRQLDARLAFPGIEGCDHDVFGPRECRRSGHDGAASAARGIATAGLGARATNAVGIREGEQQPGGGGRVEGGGCCDVSCRTACRRLLAREPALQLPRDALDAP
jgi:hypothetical protein